MTDIALDSRFFAWVRSGRKRSTIRLGVKPYTLGPGHLQGFGEQARIFITRLEVLEFAEVTREHAMLEGYRSLGELREALRQFYPKISLTDRVTLVEFDLVDPDPKERITNGTAS